MDQILINVNTVYEYFWGEDTRCLELRTHVQYDMNQKISNCTFPMFEIKIYGMSENYIIVKIIG